MKKILSILAGAALLLSCQKDMLNSDLLAKLKAGNETSLVLSTTSKTFPQQTCPTKLVTTLVNSNYPSPQETVKGRVEIYNDNSYLYVTVSSIDSLFRIGTIKLMFGDSTEFLNWNKYYWDGYSALAEPDSLVNFNPRVQSYTFRIPLSGINRTCVLVNVHVMLYWNNQWGQPQSYPVWLKALNPTSYFASFPWTGWVEYCIGQCPPPKDDKCPKHQTPKCDKKERDKCHKDDHDKCPKYNHNKCDKDHHDRCGKDNKCWKDGKDKCDKSVIGKCHKDNHDNCPKYNHEKCDKDHHDRCEKDDKCWKDGKDKCDKSDKDKCHKDNHDKCSKYNHNKCDKDHHDRCEKDHDDDNDD